MIDEVRVGIRIQPSQPHIGISVQTGGGCHHDIYDGPVDVTPQAWDAQTLETAGKLVQQDITVQKVPRADVSNMAGGVTVYIASQT